MDHFGQAAGALIHRWALAFPACWASPRVFLGPPPPPRGPGWGFRWPSVGFISRDFPRSLGVYVEEA